MKNINVKKIVAGAAALAVGASFLGAAVASQVDFGSAITKDDVLTNGTPTAKIVVGTGGLPIDVVYAGNIAAAIASKAYKTEIRTTPVHTIPGTPGSTSNVLELGKGDVSDKDIAISVDTNSDFSITLNNYDYGKLYDGEIKGKLKDEKNYTNTLTETLDINGYTMFSTNRKTQDFISIINSGKIVYRMEFDEEIDPADFETSSSLSVYFMGQKYDVQSLTDKKMTLVGTGSTQAYPTNSEIPVTGDNGENYTVVVGNAYGSAGSDFSIQMKLERNGTILSTKLFDEQDTIEFPNYPIKESISISKIYDDTSTVNIDMVELSVGTGSLLELEDTRVLPGYKSGTKDLWKVRFIKSSKLKAIEVYNQDARWHRDDFSVNESGLKIGEKIALPLNLGNVEFRGLTEEKQNLLEIGDNLVKWTDGKGREVSTFIYEENLDGSTVNVGGRDYYFDLDGNKLKVFKGTTDTTEYKIIDNITNPSETTLALKTSSEIDMNYEIFSKNGLTLALKTTTGVGYKVGKNTAATWKFIETEGNIGHFDGDAKSSDDKYAVFEIIDDVNKTYVFLDTYTKDIARRSDYATGAKYYDNFRKIIYGGTFEYLSTEDDKNTVSAGAWFLDDVERDDLSWAYTTYGTKVEFDGSKAIFTIPDAALNLVMFAGGEYSVSEIPGEAGSTIGGDEYTVITPVNFDFSTLVVSDISIPGGDLIVVGGHMANKAAINVTEEYLTQAGQWIMGKDPVSGKIVVAGYTADDTKSAANAFINAIQ